MESTFQKFIENDPVQKAAFDKEYDAFMRSEELLDDTLMGAAAEARRICRDPSVKGYTDMDELRKALLRD